MADFSSPNSGVGR